MLYLIFRLGKERYALNSAQVVEVLPLLAWRALPGVPATVPGVFNYHGILVPVLDLAQLVHGTPAARDKSRIVLVNYGDTREDSRLLGLLVESVSSLLRLRDQDFRTAPVKSDVRYAGPVTSDDKGIIQRIELAELVPDDLWERLHAARESVVEK